MMRDEVHLPESGIYENTWRKESPLVGGFSTVRRIVDSAGCQSRRFSCSGRATPLGRDPRAGRGNGTASTTCPRTSRAGIWPAGAAGCSDQCEDLRIYSDPAGTEVHPEFADSGSTPAGFAASSIDQHLPDRWIVDQR